MRIDSHQHFWKIERGDYHWMSPALKPLYRDFLPSDLQPLATANGVEGSVVVQAAETESETRFLLDIAKDTPSVLGVVGWIDMDAGDAIARLDKLIAYGSGYLKGIRPMIQDMDDVSWIESDHLTSVFEALAKRGLVFDALIHPCHIASLQRRLLKHPTLKCVIDHGAKPDISSHARSAWSSAMQSIAQNTSAYCKLSGLVTEAGDEWSDEDIKPYGAEILDHFGADRVLWGSDWPVLNLASDYAAWVRLAERCCYRLTDAEKVRVFGRNAVELYGLEGLCPS